MSSDAVIEVSNLSKCYYIYAQPEDRLKQMIFPKVQGLFNSTPKQYFTEYWASRHISFSVGRGETVGIVGRNGSGKSTLLQMICGTLEPTEGTIKTNGRIAALLELGAGFSPDFTGRQNAVLNAQILGLTDDEIAGRIADIEAFADVGEFFDRPVKTYSSGMYVRVAFAVQAMVEPEILVVDEALAVGDAPFQAKCMARINKLKERGTSILFVSHDISSVRLLCNKVIWLDGGTVKMTGAVIPVTAKYTEAIFEDSDVTQAPFKTTDEDKESGNILPSKTDLLADVVNHFGSQQGTILQARLLNSDGVESRYIQNYQTMTAHIIADISKITDRSHLSVAFSIKDNRGLDIIVGTTWDDDRLMASVESNIIEVKFEFENMLNSGHYMLVAAVEDRSNPVTNYYEYIEGVKHIQVDFDSHQWGVVRTPFVKTMVNSDFDLN